MILKLIKGNGKERIFECPNYEITIVTPEMVSKDLARHPDDRFGFDEAGIKLELSPVKRGDPMQLILMPEHGSLVYVMNDRGQTTDKIVWPIVPKHP